METLRESLYIFLLFLVNVALTLTGNANDQSQKMVTWSKVQKNDSQYVKVVRVVDGDTIVIDGDIRVRYIGIDTPELGNDKTVHDCYAEAAKQKNQELVEGKMVRLEKDVSEKDRHGRLLRYVYQDSVFVNEDLVQQGYAKAATFPPDVRYSDYFLKLQTTAREEKRGLWDMCYQ